MLKYLALLFVAATVFGEPEAEAVANPAADPSADPSADPYLLYAGYGLGHYGYAGYYGYPYSYGYWGKGDQQRRNQHQQLIPRLILIWCMVTMVSGIMDTMGTHIMD